MHSYILIVSTVKSQDVDFPHDPPCFNLAYSSYIILCIVSLIYEYTIIYVHVLRRKRRFISKWFGE